MKRDFTLARALTAGKKRHTQPKRRQQGCKAAIMLLGQNLGRSEQCPLVAAGRSYQQSRGRHHGLA